MDRLTSFDKFSPPSNLDISPQVMQRGLMNCLIVLTQRYGVNAAILTIDDINTCLVVMQDRDGWAELLQAREEFLAMAEYISVVEEGGTKLWEGWRD